MARTSLTHPLRIDTIKIGKGQLGLSICPGKIQTNAQTGSWTRNLDIDLCAVRDWGAGTVFTMLEAEEMKALHVPELGKNVRAYGMEWVHIPLPNDAVPDAAWLKKFHEVQPALNEGLAKGDGIFIHCMGGIGRTSVAAALLLMHTRWSAEQSIIAVQNARPESFVMPEQADFVRAYEKKRAHFPVPVLQPF